MELNRTELLRFFDEKPVEARNENGQTFGSSVSAVTSLIGEDLLLDLFFHYWLRHKSQHGCLRRLATPCCAAVGQGRLDAWIVRNRNGQNQDLFQVEVKNWTYHSVNMRRHLGAEASAPDVVEVAHNNWTACVEKNKDNRKLNKVMKEMRCPQEGFAGLISHPLLCIWAPVLPPTSCASVPFFKFQCEGHILNGLWVFSASLYLRSLDIPSVELPLEGVVHRFSLLENLGAVPD